MPFNAGLLMDLIFLVFFSEKMMIGAMFFDQKTKYLSGGAGTAISRAGVKAWS